LHEQGAAEITDADRDTGDPELDSVRLGGVTTKPEAVRFTGRLLVAD